MKNNISFIKYYYILEIDYLLYNIIRLETLFKREN